MTNTPEMSPEAIQALMEKMQRETQAMLDRMTPEERAEVERKTQEMMAADRDEQQRLLDNAARILGGSAPAPAPDHVAAPAAMPKFCSSCGAPAGSGKFCEYCGSPLQKI
ncbi:MAG: hypothetical protein IJK23_13370 [Clostridia bacterium]|nr:hypothetical protein [Clostridia bacterium]